MAKTTKTDKPEIKDTDLKKIQQEEAEAKAKEQAEQEKQSPDKDKAAELMDLHEVDEVYKVGKYWFTKKEYAEEAKKTTEEPLQTFKK